LVSGGRKWQEKGEIFSLNTMDNCQLQDILWHLGVLHLSPLGNDKSFLECHTARIKS